MLLATIQAVIGIFNYKDAKCLVKILLMSLDSVESDGVDIYIKTLKDISQDLVAPSYDMFLDTKITNDIDDLLNSYDSLNKDLQKNIIQCHLDTTNTLKRCEERYGRGRCTQLNPVAYIQKCPEEHFNQPYKSFYCYKKCPPNFEERDNRCIKPEIKKYRPFATREDCEKASEPGTKCTQYYEGVWVPDCPPLHQKFLKFYCIPYCPPGWIEDRTSCIKLKRLDLGLPVVLNYMDLILDEDKNLDKEFVFNTIGDYSENFD
jgi:hypothetical protein